MAITSFKNEYSFLSNFYPSPIFYEGNKYPSVENAYQASKCKYPLDKVKFFSCTSTKAKQYGKKLKIRDDWDSIKLTVMEELVRLKFQIPLFKELLLNTRFESLIEGNWWGDTFWGVCKGVGENHLGRIIMKVRTELQDQND